MTFLSSCRFIRSNRNCWRNCRSPRQLCLLLQSQQPRITAGAGREQHKPLPISSKSATFSKYQAQEWRTEQRSQGSLGGSKHQHWPLFTDAHTWTKGALKHLLRPGTETKRILIGWLRSRAQSPWQRGGRSWRQCSANLLDVGWKFRVVPLKERELCPRVPPKVPSTTNTSAGSRYNISTTFSN